MSCLPTVAKDRAYCDWVVPFQSVMYFSLAWLCRNSQGSGHSRKMLHSGRAVRQAIPQNLTDRGLFPPPLLLKRLHGLGSFPAIAEFAGEIVTLQNLKFFLCGNCKGPSS
jgi:hypothetical protein